MNITEPQSSFCKLGVHIQTWLFLVLSVLLLSGCKTVPIQDRNFAESSGFWEQDENMGVRFHRNAGASDAVIGMLYASGKNVLLNGDQVKVSASVKNNAFISSGMQSGARIEFKASDSTCSIRIDRFNAGKAYADTSSCLHDIETLYARIQAQNAVLQINVSQQQTIIYSIDRARSYPQLSSSNSSGVDFEVVFPDTLYIAFKCLVSFDALG